MRAFDFQMLTRIIGLVVSVVIFLCFIQSVFNYTDFTSDIQEIENPNYLLIFFITIFLEGIPQLASPTLILTSVLLNGSGPGMIVAVISVASFIGSMIGYLVGYYYTAVGLFISREKKGKSDKSREYINRYGRLSLAVIAMTPLPYFPVVFGALKLRCKDFIFFGAFVRSLSYVIYGYFLYSVL